MAAAGLLAERLRPANPRQSRAAPGHLFKLLGYGGGGWENLLLALVTAISGTLVEMILVAAGAFAYLRPDFLGVPYWLPCIYACASQAVGDFGRALLTRDHP